MENFCILEENDEKNIIYINKFLNAIKNNISIMEIDNKIQWEEINKHCEINNIYERERECIDWVNKNGKNFRIFLNTLKIATIIIYAKDTNIDKVDRETYCEIMQVINKSKHLLNYVF